MKMPDSVAGVLAPYANQFHLWNSNGTEYKPGDVMPAVGMAVSYSVQLRIAADAPEKTRIVFLQVQEGRLTNTMALQPLGDKSVFDPQGRYLGQGGGELEPMGPEKTKPPVDLVTAVKQMNEPAPPPEPACHFLAQVRLSLPGRLPKHCRFYRQRSPALSARLPPWHVPSPW